VLTSCQMPQSVDAYTQQLAQILLIQEPTMADHIMREPRFSESMTDESRIAFIHDDEDMNRLSATMLELKHLRTAFKLNRQVIRFEVNVLKDYGQVIQQAELTLPEEVKTLLSSSRRTIADLRTTIHHGLHALKTQGRLIRQAWANRPLDFNQSAWLKEFIVLVEDFNLLHMTLNTNVSTLIAEVSMVGEALADLMIDENLTSAAFLDEARAIRINFAEMTEMTHEIHNYHHTTKILRQAIRVEVKFRQDAGLPLTEAENALLSEYRVQLMDLNVTLKNLVEARMLIIQQLVLDNQTPDYLSIAEPVLLLHDNLSLSSDVWFNRINLLQQTLNVIASA
jgi:hypothetical protein